jgi:MFS family permease
VWRNPDALPSRLKPELRLCITYVRIEARELMAVWRVDLRRRTIEPIGIDANAYGCSARLKHGWRRQGNNILVNQRASFSAFSALMLGNLAQGTIYTAFPAALPQIAKDYGGGAQGQFIAEQVLMIAALGMMTGAFSSGWILERVRSRTVMFVGMATFSLFGAGGMFLHQPWSLLASRYITGFACACMVTTCIALIAHRYSGHDRARVLGIVAAMAGITALIFTLSGGWLDKIGGWRLTFVLYPAFGSIGLVVLLLAGRNMAPSDGAQAKRTMTTSNGAVFRRLWLFYAVTVLIVDIMFMASAQLSFMLSSDGIHDPFVRAVIMSMVPLLIVCTSFAYGPLQRRLGSMGALVLGLLAMCIALLTADFTSSAASATVAAMLMGVFVGTTFPFLHHHVTDHSTVHERGHAVGLLNAFIFLGAFLNPLVFVPLAEKVGLHNSFLAAAMVMFAAACVLPFLRQFQPTRTLVDLAA